MSAEPDARAPDAVAPPPHHPRFPLVDGIRAIAVLAIVVVHSAVAGRALGGSLGGRLLAHLNVGVAIFFVVSGFLLFRPFIAERAGGAAAPAVSDYGKRRVLRIFPAYWLALAVLTVLPGLTGVYGGHWFAQLGLVQTLPPSPSPNCTQALLSCDLAQTWSLVVEATFYLLLPVYVVASRLLFSSGRARSWLARELALLICLAAVSVLVSFSSTQGTALDWVRSSALGYWLWFALGMALAIVSAAGPEAGGMASVAAWTARHPWLPWAAAAGVYLALAFAVPATPYLLSTADQRLAHLGFGLISVLVVMPAVFSSPTGGGPARVLRARSVAWVGLVSYGVFLWHYAFTVELGLGGAGWSFIPILLASLAGSTACAALSYYALERPVLKLKRRRILPRRGRPAPPAGRPANAP